MPETVNWDVIKRSHRDNNGKFFDLHDTEFSNYREHGKPMIGSHHVYFVFSTNKNTTSLDDDKRRYQVARIDPDGSITLPRNKGEPYGNDSRELIFFDEESALECCRELAKLEPEQKAKHYVWY